METTGNSRGQFALEKLNLALSSGKSQQQIGGRPSGKKWNTGRKDDDYKPDQEHVDEFNKHCPEYSYIPASLPAVERIVAIGDIHGDWKLAERVLKLAKLIDDEHNWIADPPETVVVQVGDQVDRCRPFSGKCENANETIDDENSDVKILEFFNTIHEKAARVGGAVYSLLGNHEIMNVQGDLRYVSHMGLKGFAKNWDPAKLEQSIKHAKRDRAKAFEPGSDIAKMIACTRSSVIIIGSNLFVHAAVLEALLKEYDISGLSGFDRVNAAIRRWLLKALGNDENVDKLLVDENISPFWPRVLGQIPPNTSIDHPDCAEYLKPVLETLHLDRMVIGHTPQLYNKKQGVNAVCGGHLIRADIGSSKAFAKFETGMDRRIQAVEILNDSYFRPIDSSYDDSGSRLERMERGLSRGRREDISLRHDSENGAALSRLEYRLSRNN